MDGTTSPDQQPTSNPSAGPSANIVLKAAGFNPLSQLLPNTTSDLHTFHPILPESHSTRLLFTGWSCTAFLADNTLHIQGPEPLTQSLDLDVATTLHSAFGDHDRFLGCLSTTNGALYLLDPTVNRFERQGDDDSPRLGFVALAGNGALAATIKQLPSSNLMHLLYFPTLPDFLAWFTDPPSVQLDSSTQHFPLPGRPSQLVAGAGTFTLLMESGEVYTWGDPRYRSLGRDIATSPAEQPGPVEALGGLKVVKVAAGGWVSGAVSEDRAGYVWGTGTLGEERTMAPLKEAGGEVGLVEIESAGEVADVVDLAVGEGFMAAVVEGGTVFVVGGNRCGQLGLGEGAPEFVEEWTEISDMHDVQSVVCGPKASLIYQNPPP
ncbi:uncharacterized protein LTR77_000442 [Saxophila tyrrhenica]|uniref:RCC1/BLIP-II protein n=1 Tax=Saxophila tyrrhenica TaxID=1690608 RepID=A0AAV9PN07_9PEZI|nr:hypothetical protein LTR77_000442 [Saxophila tyrrhenica]